MGEPTPPPGDTPTSPKQTPPPDDPPPASPKPTPTPEDQPPASPKPTPPPEDLPKPPSEPGDSAKPPKNKKSSKTPPPNEGAEPKPKGGGKKKPPKVSKESSQASLKFGEPKGGKKGKKAGGKSEETKGQETGTPPTGGQFNPEDYPRMTAIYFHKDNDLSLEKGVGYKPEQAKPHHGPGVTPEIEKLYGPCTLLSEFKYTTWADTVVPLRNHNVVQGFNELALFLIKLAANGGENISHEEAFLAMSFLSNIRNDLGEYPPNVLALMEHIDYLTRSDGQAEPSSKYVRPCDLDDM